MEKLKFLAILMLTIFTLASCTDENDEENLLDTTYEKSRYRGGGIDDPVEPDRD